MDSENNYGALEVQKGILDILKRVDIICQDNSIPYSLLAGSLLGAIRHQGFIPWDDDADIVIDRSHYQKLQQLLVSDPILMVTKMLWIDKIKLRVPSGQRKKSTVDLFVLDAVPSNRLLKRIKLFIVLVLQRMIIDKPRYRDYSLVNRLITWVLNTLGKVVGKKSLLRLYERASMIANSKPSEYKAIYCDQFRYIRNEYDASILSSLSKVPFEDTALSAISSYDKYLTQMYGDWRTPLSPELRKGQHITLLSNDR